MPGTSTVHEIVFSLRDFLFPPVCFCCEQPVGDNTVLCVKCIDTLTVESELHELPDRKVKGATFFSVLLPYDDMCRQVVHGLKYHGMSSIGPIMGRLMAIKTLRLLPRIDHAIILPVPLHPEKLLDRGYNQCESLAKGFAAFSGYDVRTDVLKRVRWTETQTKLTHEERQDNVRNAFQFCSATSIEGCDIILIDDVLTTGSTIEACINALMSGGAETITVSVMASPVPGEE
ncbi:ComF family protein [Candidatus Latescibacterota bacterium]